MTILFGTLCSFSTPQEQTTEYQIPDGKSVPKAEKIDDHRIKIGSVEINHKTRTISFSGEINMNRGLIEYIVGMPHGKVHETLILTETSPLHMSVGMKLLKFHSFERFFPMISKEKSTTAFIPPKPYEYIDSYLQIKIIWKLEGKEHSSDLSDMLLNPHGRKKSFPANKWLYTNSFVYNGVYQSCMTGDIIAIAADPSSVVNYTGEFNDGNNETGWQANPKEIPAPGTKITVEISQKKLSDLKSKENNQ